MVLLNPVERETMIEFHDEDGIATIFTCSPELQKRLMKLCEGDGDGYYAGKFHSGESCPMCFFLPKRDLGVLGGGGDD
jgi:hypothetical protein